MTAMKKTWLFSSFFPSSLILSLFLFFLFFRGHGRPVRGPGGLPPGKIWFWSFCLYFCLTAFMPYCLASSGKRVKALLARLYFSLSVTDWRG
jgi:drug/metabolite transporter (DMT)-like permease